MSRELLNFRHLRAFCAVADSGSVSSAAPAVHLSQPAITQAIAKLERLLQAPLYVRSSTGMFTTEPGGMFHLRAQRALALIREGARLSAGPARAKGRGGFERFDQLLTSGQLRALIAVADHGNFSLAARNVGVSQPSLHRLARDLERLSGLVLFEKTTKGIALSEAATVLARHARLAFAELQQGFDELDAWRGVDSALLVIGSLPLVRTQILPSAINELARLRPNVHVRVVDGPYDDLLHGLRNGQLDVLVGALRSPVPIADVVQNELLQDELVVLARVDHPLAGAKKIAVGNLADYPWVVARPGTPTRDHFEAMFRNAGVDVPTRIIETSSLVLMRGLLIGSDRLALISARQVAIDEQFGAVRRLPFDLSHTSRPIGTTIRRDWRPTATQALMLQLLDDAFARSYQVSARSSGTTGHSKIE